MKGSDAEEEPEEEAPKKKAKAAPKKKATKAAAKEADEEEPEEDAPSDEGAKKRKVESFYYLCSIHFPDHPTETRLQGSRQTCVQAGEEEQAYRRGKRRRDGRRVMLKCILRHLSALCYVLYDSVIVLVDCSMLSVAVEIVIPRP